MNEIDETLVRELIKRILREINIAINNNETESTIVKKVIKTLEEEVKV